MPETLIPDHLILTPNINGADDFYADLLAAHEGRDKADSEADETDIDPSDETDIDPSDETDIDEADTEANDALNEADADSDPSATDSETRPP